MPNIYRIKATDAEKLYVFFKEETQKGKRVWDRGEYSFGEDSVNLEVGVVAFESKKKANEWRYAILGKILGEGSFSVVFEVDYTLSNTRAGIRFKPRGVNHQTRIVKVIETGLINGMTNKDVMNEYNLSPAYLHMKNPSFENDDAFLVMKKMEGESLSDLLEEGNLTINERLEISIALLQELKLIHATQKLHRDIKPENIIINRRARPLTARFIDFGLSIDTSKPDGRNVGSVHYAAPEVFDSRIGPQGVESDIFSLGRTLAQVWGVSSYSYNDDITLNQQNCNIFTYEDGDFFTNFELINEDARMAIRFILRQMLRQEPFRRMSLNLALSAFAETSKWLLGEHAPAMPSVEPSTSNTVQSGKPNWFYRCWQKVSGWLKKKETSRAESSNPGFSMQFIGDCSTAVALDSLGGGPENRRVIHAYEPDNNDMDPYHAIELSLECESSDKEAQDYQTISSSCR